jgi:bifunctional DNA-binding transcriptional regulator/antitoxin component of YhaV-PrlF toxin-antitoxin module
LVKPVFYQVGGLLVTTAEKFKVSTSGQMSLPAAVRRRWHLERGGSVEVIDLGFGVLTLPAGYRGRLLDQLLPAETHYAAVAAEDDPDLRST